MKKKFTRSVLALSLALAIALVLAPLTALASPGSSQESAVELKGGQSGTFDNEGGWWYKIQLAAPSKVVVTASLNAVPDNNSAAIIVFDYSNDVRNEMRSYVVPKGPLADTTYDQPFWIGVQEGGRPPSRTGTYYLDEGWYYIWINCSLDDGNFGTLKIDSIEPVNNSGGLTTDSAPTINPSKEVVKQTRYDGNRVSGAFYYWFALPRAAEVSITKSVNPAIRHDDGNPGSVLFLLADEGNEDYDGDILGEVDGEIEFWLQIRENDARLTNTITYSLPRGTYYAVLNNDKAYPGTEYTLTFTSSLSDATVGAMSNFVEAEAYTPGQFTDVNEDAWYGSSNQGVIASAFEYGLVLGTSDTTFNPTGDITVAQAVTMAARVRSIYTTGSGDFTQGTPWHQVYVDYAVANGIIDAADFSEYNRPATRAEMAYIFSRALPPSELEGHNTVNALPDVNSATPYREAILALYIAGIVGGSDESGTFNPGANINRAEASAIISRLILPDTRFSGRVYGQGIQA